MFERFTGWRRAGAEEGRPIALGPLELAVMDVVWRTGVCNVRDVVQQLDRELAYTTIMTTMDRLYKKGLLERNRTERAFLYTPQLSREDWERQRVGNLVHAFLGGPKPAHDILLSCLIDAVGEHDPKLLDELEKQIQSKRRTMLRRKKGAE